MLTIRDALTPFEFVVVKSVNPVREKAILDGMQTFPLPGPFPKPVQVAFHDDEIHHGSSASQTTINVGSWYMRPETDLDQAVAAQLHEVSHFFDMNFLTEEDRLKFWGFTGLPTPDSWWEFGDDPDEKKRWPYLSDESYTWFALPARVPEWDRRVGELFATASVVALSGHTTPPKPGTGTFNPAWPSTGPLHKLRWDRRFLRRTRRFYLKCFARASEGQTP